MKNTKPQTKQELKQEQKELEQYNATVKVLGKQLADVLRVKNNLINAEMVKRYGKVLKFKKYMIEEGQYKIETAKGEFIINL
jgi:hypothetical protein